MGIANVAGRLVLGLVADRYLSAIWVYMGVLFLGSAASLLIPFTTSYGYLMTEAAAFGATFGKITIKCFISRKSFRYVGCEQRCVCMVC